MFCFCCCCWWFYMWLKWFIFLIKKGKNVGKKLCIFFISFLKWKSFMCRISFLKFFIVCVQAISLAAFSSSLLKPNDCGVRHVRLNTLRSCWETQSSSLPSQTEVFRKLTTFPVDPAQVKLTEETTKTKRERRNAADDVKT